MNNKKPAGGSGRLRVICAGAAAANEAALRAARQVLSQVRDPAQQRQ